jgi:Ser/Thr protein kinase RdoA (MazF antagonist)
MITSMPAPPLAAACAAADLDPAGAVLLHQRANAVYHLPAARAILRLRHTRGSAEWQQRLASAVAVTSWLHAQGMPTICPLPVEQPVTVDGWTVTYWRYVPADDTEAPTTVLGELLAALHTLPAPPVDLVPTNPLGQVLADVEHADEEVLSSQQRDWLRARAEQISAAYATAALPLGSGLIHGDAHTGNLLRSSGRWLLGDWDSVSTGPRLQDLIPTLDGVRHFGAPASTWHELCRAYGVPSDLADRPGTQLLAQARELRSLAAYIRTAHRSDVRAELNKRLDTLMRGIPATWQAV